jgi:hypothetical protein
VLAVAVLTPEQPSAASLSLAIGCIVAERCSGKLRFKAPDTNRVCCVLLLMYSVEGATHALARHVTQAFMPTTLQLDAAAQRNAPANHTSNAAHFQNFGARSMFPHLAFLLEPPRGSLRQQYEGSNVKWDIDADCKLKSELETINTLQTVAEPHAASLTALVHSRDCSVRAMQLSHRDHPAWLRLQAAAAAPSLRQEFLQRTTVLSDSRSFSNITGVSPCCRVSSAGCSARGSFPQGRACDAGGGGQRADKRQREEAAFGCHASELDTAHAFQDCSSCLDGVNWIEELRCLDQEEAPGASGGEETTARGCVLLEPE